MAIHTKTLVAGVDDYFEGIIDFFEDYPPGAADRTCRSAAPGRRRPA